jgi:alpha-L-fucosidase
MTISKEERLAWWHEARFGMFIHWGLYAALAGSWNGKKTPGIGEWIMHDLKIPIEEYEKLADSFNPTKFDAEAWVDVAEAAGMKYLVITAKHHDGFCMFDSPSNPYNIVNKTPFKRDPMKELAEACNKRGIKMCFYYSQAQDWHAPGGSGHWEEETEGKNWSHYNRPAEDFQKYLDDVVKPNLKELLTNYGPIGLIWFDTPVGINKEQSESLRDLVHELQPECLVSGRVGHDVGDYGSLGDNAHPTGPVKDAWETPATLNDTWGYRDDDHNWKSAEFLLQLLVNCASKGVNYLLNVGPTAEGVIPQPSVEILQALGKWTKVYGEAIYGTTGSPFPLDPDWGRITTKGSTIYLLVSSWPEIPLELQGLQNQVLSARVLGPKCQDIHFEQKGDLLTLPLPADAPEDTISVIAVELDGPVQVEPIVIQNDDSITLPLHMADLSSGLEPNPSGFIEGWTLPEHAARWTFRMKTPGRYQVDLIERVHRHRQEAYGTPTVIMTFAETEYQAKVDFAKLDMSEKAKAYQHIPISLGVIEIPSAGDHDIQIKAKDFTEGAGRGLSLVSLRLTTVS